MTDPMATPAPTPYPTRLKQMPVRHDCTQWQYLQDQHLQASMARKRLIQESSVYYSVETGTLRELSPLNNIAKHFTVERVRAALDLINEDGAPGVDGITVDRYRHSGDLDGLVHLVRNRRYRSQPLRRKLLDKGNGHFRPLGIPCVVDRVVQRTWSLIVEQVFEPRFLPCSFGYRPERNCHQALEEIAKEISTRGRVWILDADFSNYFGTVSHDLLMDIIRRHITDPVFLQFCWTTLTADVVVDGIRERVTKGTPQGGVISPLFANIYAHVVLDAYFEEVIRPRLNAWSRLIRYADDFVVLTESEEDAMLAKMLISERVGQYGLALNPDKTHIRNLTCPELEPLTAAEELQGHTTLDGQPPSGYGAARELPFLGYELSWRILASGWTLVGKTAPRHNEKALARCDEHFRKLEMDIRAEQRLRRQRLGASCHLLERLNLSVVSHIMGFAQYYKAEDNEEALIQYEEGVVRFAAALWDRCIDPRRSGSNPYKDKWVPLWPTVRLRSICELSGRNQYSPLSEKR